MTKYFRAINRHNYYAYVALLTPAGQADETPSSFAAGFSSTFDSQIVLRRIADTASYGVGATVTFTSHQNASQGPDGTGDTCDLWRITLFLQPSAGGYLIGGHPSWYRGGSFEACP